MASLLKSKEHVKVQVSSSTPNVLVNLTQGQDYSQCTVLGYSVYPDDSDWGDSYIDWLSSISFEDNAGTPAVRIRTNSTSTTIGNVAFDVLEWLPAVDVQQIAVGGPTTSVSTFNIAISSVVDIDTAFVVFPYRFSGLVTEVRRSRLSYYLSSTTQVTFNRYDLLSSGNDVDGTLFVVRHPDLSVQHISDALDSAAKDFDIVISAVDLGKTFSVMSYQYNHSNDEVHNMAFVGGLIDTTTYQFSRAGTGSAASTPDSEARAQIVSCPADEWSVQHFIEEDAVSEDSRITISTVDLDKAVVLPGHPAGAHALIETSQTGIAFSAPRYLQRFDLPNASQIRVLGYMTSAGGRANAEVVEFELGAAPAPVGGAMYHHLQNLGVYA